jgi:hypothetical protein
LLSRNVQWHSANDEQEGQSRGQKLFGEGLDHFLFSFYLYARKPSRRGC